MQKRPLIVANWKMHKTHVEAQEFVKALLPQIPKAAEVWIAPSFTALGCVSLLCQNSSLKVGAQTLYEADQGAFTGEVSGGQLKALGVSFVLVGHSERRTLFHETSSQVARKVAAALKHQLVPILCVGETLSEREQGKTEIILKKQLEESLAGIAPDPSKPLIVAYEPVWAIGTGKSATPEMGEAAHRYMRSILQSLNFAKTVLLYGGSVKKEGVHSLLQQPNIDGVLVGGASLDLQTFTDLIVEAVR